MRLVCVLNDYFQVKKERKSQVNFIVRLSFVSRVLVVGAAPCPSGARPEPSETRWVFGKPDESGLWSRGCGSAP